MALLWIHQRTWINTRTSLAWSIITNWRNRSTSTWSTTPLWATRMKCINLNSLPTPVTRKRKAMVLIHLAMAKIKKPKFNLSLRNASQILEETSQWWKLADSKHWIKHLTPYVRTKQLKGTWKQQMARNKKCFSLGTWLNQRVPDNCLLAIRIWWTLRMDKLHLCNWKTSKITIKIRTKREAGREKVNQAVK